MSQKAIEKLTKNVVFWDNEGEGRIAQLPRADYDQLLAELKAEQPEPKCKTCGDSRRVPTPQSIGFGKDNAIIQECPDCKSSEQPPDSELTKWVRENYSEDGACGKTIYKLCARLDASQASRKVLLAALKKYGDHEAGCIKGDACNCGLKKAIEKGKE